MVRWMVTESLEGAGRGDTKNRRWSLALEAVRSVKPEHAVYCLVVFM